MPDPFDPQALWQRQQDHARSLPYYDAQGNRTTMPTQPSWGGWGQTSTAAPPPTPLNLGTLPGDLRGSVQGLLPAGWESFRGPLGQSMDLASGLANEENARQATGVRTASQAYDRLRQANRPMDQGELDQRMGRASDAASGQSLDRWKALRSQLGEMGNIGGGLAAGLGSQIELGRLGQIQGSKRDIAIAEADRRSQNASQEFMAAMNLGNFQAQGPSMLGLDQFNSLLDFGSNVVLGEKEIEASKYAARQSRRAGKDSMIGSIFGGLLGAL